MTAGHSFEPPETTSLRPVDGRASFMATLSLFLLLLAFFVLLSTLSRFEATRTKAVLGSLDATFRTNEDTGSARELDSLVGSVVGAERLAEVVTDILRTAVALDTYVLVRVGSELMATLTVSDLFEEGITTPRPGVANLADALAEAMSEQPTGLRYELDVMMHPADGAETLAVARVGVLAQAFSAGGVQVSDLAVGLTDGDPKSARLVFRVLTTETPALSFSDDILGGGG